MSRDDFWFQIYTNTENVVRQRIEDTRREYAREMYTHNQSLQHAIHNQRVFYAPDSDMPWLPYEMEDREER